jgi:hypothetical protein
MKVDIASHQTRPQLLAARRTNESMGDFFGVTRRTIQKWIATHPDLADAVYCGLAAARRQDRPCPVRARAGSCRVIAIDTLRRLRLRDRLAFFVRRRRFGGIFEAHVDFLFAMAGGATTPIRR